LVGVFVVLAAVLGACGDASNDSAKAPQTIRQAEAPAGTTSTADAGTTGPTGTGGSAATGKPASGGAGGETPAAGNSDGGTNKSSGGQPASGDSSGQTDSQSQSGNGGGSGKSKKKKSKSKVIRKTPEQLAKDLYEAGKGTCYIFGVDQIVREYSLTTSKPEDVARYYAALFEKQHPELVAPYYQGCLAGLKKRARSDAPKG
jgi:hypothetical protein